MPLIQTPIGCEIYHVAATTGLTRERVSGELDLPLRQMRRCPARPCGPLLQLTTSLMSRYGRARGGLRAGGTNVPPDHCVLQNSKPAAQNIRGSHWKRAANRRSGRGKKSPDRRSI